MTWVKSFGFYCCLSYKKLAESFLKNILLLITYFLLLNSSFLLQTQLSPLPFLGYVHLLRAHQGFVLA